MNHRVPEGILSSMTNYTADTNPTAIWPRYLSQLAPQNSHLISGWDHPSLLPSFPPSLFLSAKKEGIFVYRRQKELALS